MSHRTSLLCLLAAVVATIACMAAPGNREFKPVIPGEYRGTAPEGALMRIGRGSIKDIAISPDNKYLAVGSTQGVYAYLLDSNTSELWHYPTIGEVSVVRFHPKKPELLLITPSQVIALKTETGEMVREFGAARGLWADLVFIDVEGLIFATKVIPGASWHFWNYATGQEHKLPVEMFGATLTPRLSWASVSYPDSTGVELFDLHSGERLRIFELGTRSWNPTLSADGQYLAAKLVNEGQPSKIVVIDANTGTRLLQVDMPNEDIYFSFMFSPDSKYFVCVNKTSVDFWDIASATRQMSLESPDGLVAQVSFSPSGTYVAMEGENHVMLWDRERRQVIPLESISSALCDYCMVRFTSDESRLVVGTSGNVYSWEIPSGRMMGTIHGGFGGALNNIEFSSDGRTLAASATYTGELVLWDLSNGVRHESSIDAIHHGEDLIAPDLASYAAIVNDTIKLYSLSSGTLMHSFAEVDPTGASFSIDGSLLAVADSTNHKVHIWDIRTNHNLVMCSVGGSITALGSRADNVFLAAVEGGSETIIWDVTNCLNLQKLSAISSGGNSSFSDDGKFLAVGSADGESVWDVHTGRLVSTGEKCDPVPCGYRLRFTEDGSLVYDNYNPNPLYIWSVDSGKMKHAIKGEEMFLALRFSHNSKIVAIAEGYFEAHYTPDIATLALWDVQSGELLERYSDVHSAWISDIAFSPDDSIVATASRDGTIILWPVER